MIYRAILLLAGSFVLAGCIPIQAITDATNDSTSDAADIAAPMDIHPVCPGYFPCLRVDVRDAASGRDVGDALVVVAAEIGRDVGFYHGGSYTVRSGCIGSFVVTVERAGYERFVGTFRSSRDRDLGCNQEFQVIEIRLQPLSDGGPSDAAANDAARND